MTFEDQFKAAVEQLEIDAKLAGTNLTAVCREAGISRTTPDRWKDKIPSTVQLMTKMQNIIASKRRAKECLKAATESAE